MTTPPIDRILITSRDFDEYIAMFDLSEADLSTAPILDCPGGASDFACVARSRGARVTSVDPIYAWPPQELSAVVTAEIERGVRRSATAPELYDFSWAGGVERYIARRQRAAQSFLTDFIAERDGGGSTNYVAGSLPSLGFPDRSFGLALVPNLLFAYSNLFDRSWHRASVRELIRVADEVRIHPITDTAGSPYGQLDVLRDELAADGISTRIAHVPCRLRRGTEETLVCLRGD
ncbi:hypothetical protein [Nocardia sp. NPDC046763]|uniref:hypothetical protein n=1 Tax=Nocardia sp. NPDC046763 TaxID=3155256 RepID=UPI0033E08E98